MCGIAGTCWLGAEPARARKAVDRMVGAIHHRGPDSSGRVSAPFAEVGFNRLAIIDLATGDQPLANEDGSVECFLNGEIYNYRALRDDLIRRGHVLRTSSDTEVLPHLYEEHGEQMFALLRGMFIVCVVDHRRRAVVLARDQFGVKQLYYANAGGAVVFSSEIKGLLASGLVEPEVDLQSFLPYLMEFYAPGPRTLLEGVRKLPAGGLLRMEAGGAATERLYYELPSEFPPSRLRPEEAVATLTELLTESVGLQLQADVPVGISLSGGLDSSAIAALASRGSAGADLVAITISWPDSAPEELAASRALCGRLGIRHEILEPETGSFEDELPLLAWISDEPIADPATYSQYHVAEAARASVRVLLGGTGGDELLGGYGHYVLPRKKAAYAMLPGPVQHALFRAFTHRWLDADRADALASYRHSRRKWHELSRMNLGPAEEASLRAALGSTSSFGRMDAIFNAYRQYDPANQQMAADLLTYLPEQLLPMLDRATMAVSVEGRVPFIDVPLIEFCMSLQSDTKLGRPMLPKRLLRQAIADLVPPQVIENKKRGMPSHFPTFLTRYPDLTRQLLGPTSFSRNVLPSDWLDARLTDVREMQRSLPVLYPLVVFEVWHRLFVVEKSYERPTMPLSDLFELPSKTLAEST